MGVASGWYADNRLRTRKRFASSRFCGDSFRSDLSNPNLYNPTMKPKMPPKDKAAEMAATVKVREHERKMHPGGKKFSSGGEVRGVGAARPQKYKEC